jgi:hypothetical protein
MTMGHRVPKRRQSRRHDREWRWATRRSIRRSRSTRADESLSGSSSISRSVSEVSRSTASLKDGLLEKSKTAIAPATDPSRHGAHRLQPNYGTQCRRRCHCPSHRPASSAGSHRLAAPARTPPAWQPLRARPCQGPDLNPWCCPNWLGRSGSDATGLDGSQAYERKFRRWTGERATG